MPPPSLCYEERLRRRLSWRNEMNLFHQSCSATGKNIITMFPPESDMKVVDKDYWWSDKWDPLNYGQDYDFNRSFFDQFNELNHRVPTPNIAVESDENSQYTNYNMANKNCYLCFTGNFLEDSLYCYNVQESRNCYDCLFLHNCELCYECVQSQDCYECKFALHSKNCSSSAFIEDCLSCSNCFMCCNLRNKEYYAFNKQVSKQEYKKILAEYELHTNKGLAEAKKDWEQYRIKYPKRAHHNIQTENCSGEYIIQAKNCKQCYLMDKGAEDCKYVFNGFPDFKDSMDCTYSGEKAELHYETLASGSNTNNIFFSHIGITGSSNLYYCNFVAGSQNCFGCVSLRKKQYCILNKQYTKQEYEELKSRIIKHMQSTGEWGEFFPSNISPYPYNISTAQALLPLTKEQVLDRGLKWRDPDPKEYKQSSYQIPDDINNVPDSICNEVLACKNSGKNYKIIPQELEIYKKLQIPIPGICFQERHLKRMKKLNSHKTYKRQCAKTGKAMTTTYSPKRPEIVYSIEAHRKIIE